jgi:hypothetical protein
MYSDESSRNDYVGNPNLENTHVIIMAEKNQVIRSLADD